jgi:hypothetical protein
MKTLAQLKPEQKDLAKLKENNKKLKIDMACFPATRRNRKSYLFAVSLQSS